MQEPDSPDLEQRLAALERAVADLADRMDRLAAATPTAAAEGAGPPQPPSPLPAPHRRPPPHAAPAAATPAKARRVDERAVAGTGLAWIGGAAVFLGIVFFVAFAIRRDLISEPARIAIAAAGCAVLVALGLLLERRRSGPAPRVLIAVGVAGSFATLAAATQRYDLFPASVGMALAALVGVGAVVIALRLRSREIAGLGIVGALLAPMLVDADATSGALAYVAIALVAATVVAVRERWPAISLLAWLATFPQLAAWLDGEFADERPQWRRLVVLAAFGLLHLVSAVAHELRRTGGRRGSVEAMLVLNSAAFALVGAGVLEDEVASRVSVSPWVWVAAVAALHGALVALVAVLRRGSPLLVTAATLAAAWSMVAAAMGLERRWWVAAWCAVAVAVVVAGRLVGERRLLPVAAAVLAAAAGRALIVTPPTALLDGSDDLAGAWVSFGALALAAAVIAAAATTAGPWPSALRHAAGTVAPVALLYVASVTLVQLLDPDEQRAQVGLSVMWGVVGLAAIVAGLVRGWSYVRVAGLVVLGLAMAKLVVYDLRNLDSLSRALSFIGVGLLGLAGAFAEQRLWARAERARHGGDASADG